MTRLLLYFLLVFSCSNLFAQTTDEELAVKATIDRLFDGMRAGDSTIVRSVFDSTARLQTAFFDKDGKPVLRTGSIDRFVGAVGTPHDEMWDEKIWSFDVLIDGLLATAWTDYTFFLGKKMSHCGVNAFHLFKSENGWKITQITDTRRQDGCQTESIDEAAAINALMDAWHHAAAIADEDTFFGTMSADGIYLGTDATEKWQRDVMKEWSKKYFEQDSAWDFKANNREVYISKNKKTAWFDELLDTWMGTCRGSGVLRKTEEGWELVHYNLAVAVPNDTVNDYIKLLKKD